MNKFPPKKPPVFNTKGVDSQLLKRLLKEMIRIRHMEQTIANLVDEGKVRTPCHLYIGQEAVAVGICAALRKDDYVFGTHRSHGHYLAKGGDLKKAMAEIFCRKDGCSHGRGGSMHLSSLDVGILGTSSIVSGSIPLAIGAGLAELLKESDRISVVFHGDGVPEEGAWNESLNFAAINKLPVLFVCENNLYCTHQPLEERRVKDNLDELADAHGVSSVRVDGNNVVEVFQTTNKLVEAIRKGGGPRFIECRTYRWLGHVGPRDNLEVGLRSKQELEAWLARCPISTYSKHLTDAKILDETQIADLDKAADAEIKEAVAFAEQSPFPDPANLFDHVYASGLEP